MKTLTPPIVFGQDHPHRTKSKDGMIFDSSIGIDPMVVQSGRIHHFHDGAYSVVQYVIFNAFQNVKL